MIYQYNKNVVITPNAIPRHDYFPVQKTESEYTRIFWQGSITHETDVKILKDTVKKLDNKFMMVMAGMTDHPAWIRMANYFTNYQKKPGVVIPAKSTFEYYSNYQFADVCVCPLVPTKFNGFKSNLKVLEAAHSGLPVIASFVHPYLSLPILYAKHGQDWSKWLNDTEALKECAVKLQNHVRLNYDFDQINLKRKECFE
jgi:glycosyltransferase involved in cell wall biosynthesis